MIWGATGFRVAWIDGWRSFDEGDVASVKDALGDEVGEAQDGHGDAVSARCNAQQRVGDHCGKELQADGIFVVAEELADLEMLLDPAEQKLDLPAAFVKGCDLDGRTFEIVGQQCDGLAVLTLNDDPTQSDRELGIAFAGQDSPLHLPEW